MYFYSQIIIFSENQFTFVNMWISNIPTLTVFDSMFDFLAIIIVASAETSNWMNAKKWCVNILLKYFLESVWIILQKTCLTNISFVSISLEKSKLQ